MLKETQVGQFLLFDEKEERILYKNPSNMWYKFQDNDRKEVPFFKKHYISDFVANIGKDNLTDIQVEVFKDLIPFKIEIMSPNAASYHSSNKTLALGSSMTENMIDLWDVEKGKPTSLLLLPSKNDMPLVEMKWSRSGEYLAFFDVSCRLGVCKIKKYTPDIK